MCLCVVSEVLVTWVKLSLVTCEGTYPPSEVPSYFTNNEYAGSKQAEGRIDYISPFYLTSNVSLVELKQRVG